MIFNMSVTQFKFGNLLLVGLLVLLTLVRVFAFQDSVQFDSDFGRDSLFAMRILTEKPTMLGAQASVGGFYLGPLYFYGLALIYSIFGFAPQMVSLVFVTLNVLAGLLIFKFLTKHISRRAGFLGLLLFALNPLMIVAARGATHMPMLPVITVLSVMALYQALVKKKKQHWHLLSGLVFGLFFHVHFSSLLLLPGYFLAVAWWGGSTWQDRLKACFLHGLGMVLMVSPLILFDLRHGFITSQAFLKYLIDSATGQPITLNLQHWTLAQKINNLIGAFTQVRFLQLLLLIFAGIGLRKKWASKSWPLNLPNLLSLLFVSMTLLYFLYSGYLFTYYLVIPVTLGVLLLAVGLEALPSFLLSSILVVIISVFSISQIKPIYQPTFRNIAVLSRITHEIESHLDETRPNSFTIFKNSHDQLTGLGYEYRFLLQRDGYLPTHELAYNAAEVLYVIQEDQADDPLTLGNWEITQFGPQTAQEIATLNLEEKTVKIFVLNKNDVGDTLVPSTF